jgi:glycosyltransferase involved in cell wall biosynthesis
MHILVITDHFTPEVSAPSTRTHAHAKAWVAAGHEVTVVTCAPNFPRGKLFPGYRNGLYQEEMLDGFRVIRVWSYMAPNSGTVRRTLDYVSFAASVILQGWRFPKSDIWVATSPPIFVAMGACIAAAYRRTPWIFEVRDLWPASIQAVGYKAGLLLRLIEKMELALYRSARRVMVLTAPFREDISERGIDAAKIDVVTNGTDVDDALVVPAPDMRTRFGLRPDTVVVGFIGTLGMAQGAGILSRAAARLREHRDIEILVVGEGAERAAIQQAAEAQGLTNIHFHNYVPQAEVAGILAALDIGTVLLRNDPVFRTVIPSKIFELFAAARPVIGAVEGEARRIIREGDGLCVTPEDDAAFADAILALARDPERRRAVGQQGLRVVGEKYSRSRMAQLALECFQRALKGPGGG